MAVAPDLLLVSSDAACSFNPERTEEGTLNEALRYTAMRSLVNVADHWGSTPNFGKQASK